MTKEIDPAKLKEKILKDEKLMEKMKLEIMKSASKALDYHKLNPDMSSEQIIEDVLKESEETGPYRVASMAAAAKALDYREFQPRLSDKDIMQKIMNESEKIVLGIDVDID